MSATVPPTALNDGTTIPQLGFGVFLVEEGDIVASVASALSTGYRHIDTAAVYRNEPGVGQAIAESGIARDELYVTTKVWNTDQGFDSTIAACKASLQRLGLEYLDLYLIHWPVPSRDLYVETYKALLALREEGLIRSVGVSNFQPDHLRRITDETGVAPVLNQIEVHPYLQQPGLVEVHNDLDVRIEAWSPLGRGNGVLTDPVITDIAQRLGHTPAQVVLRWHLERGHVVIPKSITPSRIAENFDVFGFELTEDDHVAISTLDKGERVGPDPDTYVGD